MKAVKIGELKDHLSKYLRLVRNGETIRVLDREEPIAEIGPVKPTGAEIFARLIRDGKCKAATADASVESSLKPLKLKKALTLRSVLDDLRGLDGD